jgi:hypothetical protein
MFSGGGGGGAGGVAGGATGGAGAATGGAGGVAGIGGSAEAGSTGGAGGIADSGVVDASDEGGVACGKNRCGGGQYCCNPSCGVCAPMAAMCTAIVCLDADSGTYGCTAAPSLDATDCIGGRPPRYYRCLVPYKQPAGCVSMYVGNATDTYCCP